ncbi:MAG: M24 family metallopeptidase, partial [Pseudomonadales bacterium]
IRSMLIDAGVTSNGYAADVTRTYAFRQGVFADLINALDIQQQAIIEDIQPGMNYIDLHRRMHLRLAEVLREFGLVDMSPSSMVESNLTSTFLPHGLGHLLGLQTHDVAGFVQNREGDILPAPDQFPALRLTRPIEEGQVFTIEPGLYFIPMLLDELRSQPMASDVNWPKVDILLPFGGIRIEDNIAIQNDAPINLTRQAFAKQDNG